MKKFIGCIVTWILYWLGDLVSKPMYYIDLWWLYPVYNRLMIWSVDVQDWSGADGPWGTKEQ
jgi:hypothetical protein